MLRFALSKLRSRGAWACALLHPKRRGYQKNVAMVGAGHVGLVAAACLADFGIKVHYVDVDAERIESLRRLKVGFQEPGLNELVQKNAQAGRLCFSTNLAKTANDSLVIFVAVGPEDESPGLPNLKYLFEAGRDVARHMQEYKVLVIKSSVPVGTASRLRDELGKQTRAGVLVISSALEAGLNLNCGSSARLLNGTLEMLLVA